MILVFGAGGQVGREISLFPKTVPVFKTDCDITNQKSVHETLQFYRPRVVINASAYTNVDKAEENANLAYAVNSDGVKNLAIECAFHRTPLVHISTDYVFDGSGCVPWKTTDKLNPINVYGASKAVGESHVRNFCEHYVILRTSWIFSSHGKNFVTSIIETVKSKDEIFVVSDQIGGPTSAEGVASACYAIALQLMDQPNKSGVYHYSGNPTVSWFDFAVKITNLLETGTKVRPVATENLHQKCLRPLNSRLDCSKILSEFGLLQPNWEIDLHRVITSLREV